VNHDSADQVPHIPDDVILTDAELEEVVAGKALKGLTSTDMEGFKGWYSRLPNKARG
jgi:hypothetical protein